MSFKNILKLLYFLLAIYTAYMRIMTFRTMDIIHDDSYMFVRYAHNILQNGTYGWIANQPSYGCTSILYVFSHVFFMFFGVLNILDLSNYVYYHSILYFILALFLLNINIDYILKGLDKKISITIVFCLFPLPLLWLQITGMDTLAATCINFLLIYLCLRHLKANNKLSSIIWMIVVCYLSFLIRPDNLLYATLFPFLWLVLHKETKRNLVLFCFTLGGILALHGLLTYVYFGNILPIPYYVKTPNFYKAYLGIDKWNTFEYLSILVIFTFPFIVLILYGFLQKVKPILVFLIPWFISTGVMMNKVQIMGMYSRYFIPSIPFLIIPGLLVLRDLKKGKESYFFIITKLCMIVLGIFITLSYSTVIGNNLFREKQKKAEEVACNYEMTFKDNLYDHLKSELVTSIIDDLVKEVNDVNFTMAASEHGYISALHRDNVVVCLAGLHNTHILKERAFNTTVIRKSLDEYKPDFMWLPHVDYPVLRHDLIYSKIFRKNYDLYYNIFDFGIAIRKDSPFKEKIIKFFKNHYNLKTMPSTQYFENDILKD